MMMIVPGQLACQSHTELHESTLLEFSTAMKCFTDDSNDTSLSFFK